MKPTAAYKECGILSAKNSYSEGNPERKRPAASLTTSKKPQSEPRTSPAFASARPQPGVRVLNFWHRYSFEGLAKSTVHKAVSAKLSDFSTLSSRQGARYKVIKISRPFYRSEEIERDRTDPYSLLINEYQRLVELELAGNFRDEDRIKKVQVEAELDVLEAKKTLEVRGGSYQSDIDKLIRLIEIAKEIRILK